MNKSRVTIVMDDKLGKKLRVLQASLITASKSGWSFSAVVNEVLEEGLKQFSKSKTKKLSKYEYENI